MGPYDTNDLIDLIYDAALEPKLWVPIMRAINDRIGGFSGWISQLSKADGSGASAKDWLYGVDPFYGRSFAEYYRTLNPFSNTADPDAYMRDWSLSISTFDSVMPRETLWRSEYGADFLLPQGISDTLMIRLGRLSRFETAVMNLNCPVRGELYDDDDLAFVSALHPHMVRAFGLGRRLAAERLTAGAEAATGHAVFVLDETGRAQRLNAMAEQMVRRQDVLRMPAGQLTAADANAMRRLDGMIRRALSDDPDARCGGALALATPRGARPIQVTVTPVSAERALPHRVGRMAIVCATDLNRKVELPEDRLRALFGLTKAECRVALALFDGESPKEAAERLRVSVQTVRNQLASVYDKLGVRSQMEMTSLLWRLVP